MGIGGQASGDFKLDSSALRILYSLIKDSIPTLADDGFTQDNPPVVTAAANVSTTYPADVKKGVLGGSVAFLRPDVGSNVVGGAAVDGMGDYYVGTRPVGLFINDAKGGAYENTPAVSSGKCPFLRGGSVGVKLYETQKQIGADDDLTYLVGDFVYASVNGLLTKNWEDSYEKQWIDAAGTGSGAMGVAIEPDVTRMGVVLSPPDANSSELFLALFF